MIRRSFFIENYPLDTYDSEYDDCMLNIRGDLSISIGYHTCTLDTQQMNVKKPLVHHKTCFSSQASIEQIYVKAGIESYFDIDGEDTDRAMRQASRQWYLYS